MKIIKQSNIALINFTLMRRSNCPLAIAICSSNTFLFFLEVIEASIVRFQNQLYTDKTRSKVRNCCWTQFSYFAALVYLPTLKLTENQSRILCNHFSRRVQGRFQRVYALMEVDGNILEKNRAKLMPLLGPHLYTMSRFNNRELEKKGYVPRKREYCVIQIGIAAGSIITFFMLEKRGIFPGLPFPILLGLTGGLITGFFILPLL